MQLTRYYVMLLMCILTLNAAVLDDNATQHSRLIDTDHNRTISFKQAELPWGETFMQSIDVIYDYGTATVIVVGSAIDYSLCKMLSDENSTKDTLDNNETIPRKKPLEKKDETLTSFTQTVKGKEQLPEQIDEDAAWREGERTYIMSRWFDRKTMSEGFLDMNNASYLRLRGGYAYDYRDDNEWIHSLAARIKIPRTKNRYDLIIGDETKNTSDLSLEGTAEERDKSIALGVNRHVGPKNLINARFRVGFSGIDNPYAKMTFDRELLYGKWLFKPSQAFRYSVQDEFEEWTNLEFKRRISSNELFNLLFQRSTISHVKGMAYRVQPSILYDMGEYGTWTPYLGLYGRTKALPPDEDAYIPKRGVYQYAIGLNWSKQAKRKYIVYRIQPIVNYDDRYQFRPNYLIKGLLEFYFGLRE